MMKTLFCLLYEKFLLFSCTLDMINWHDKITTYFWTTLYLWIPKNIKLRKQSVSKKRTRWDAILPSWTEDERDEKSGFGDCSKDFDADIRQVSWQNVCVQCVEMPPNTADRCSAISYQHLSDLPASVCRHYAMLSVISANIATNYIFPRTRFFGLYLLLQKWV